MKKQIKSYKKRRLKKPCKDIVLGTPPFASFFWIKVFYKDIIPIILLFNRPSVNNNSIKYYSFPKEELKVLISDEKQVANILFSEVIKKDDDFEISPRYKYFIKQIFTFIIKKLYLQSYKQLLNSKQIIICNDQPFLCYFEENKIYFEIINPINKNFKKDSVNNLDFFFRISPDILEEEI